MRDSRWLEWRRSVQAKQDFTFSSLDLWGSTPKDTWLDGRNFAPSQPPLALTTTYSLTSPISVIEGGQATFTLSRTGDKPAETLYFSCLSDGTANWDERDFSTTSGGRPLNIAINFSSGESTETVKLNILEDGQNDSGESFRVIIQRNASDPASTYLLRSDFIKIYDADKPDLVIDDVEINGQAIGRGATYGTSFRPGDEVTLDWIVDNIGAGHAGSSEVGIYLSRGGESLRVEFNSTTALDGGDADTGETDTFTLLSTLEPGIYGVELRADDKGEVAESNENNNPYLFYINIEAAPGTVDVVREGTDTTAALAMNGNVSGRIDAEPISGDGVTSDQQGGFIDKDWYKVTLERGHVYTFNGVSTSVSTGAVAISLYNASGVQVQGVIEGASPSFSYDTSGQSSTTMNYYIAISAGGPEPAWRIATGNYTIGVRDGGAPPPPPADDFRDDLADSSAPLGSLTVGNGINGYIGPADANDSYGDKDVFQVNLTAGQIYDFRLRSTTVSGSALPAVVFTIRDNNFNQLEISGSGTDEHEIFTAERTGTYYVRVGSGGSSNDTGGYRLEVNSVQTSQVPDDWADTPNDAGMPGNLSPGSSQIGAIETSGDKDYFAVTLQGGKIYHFSVDGEDRPGAGSIGTVALSLRGPNNFDSFLKSTGGSDRAGYDYEVTQTGTYYIRVGAGSDSADTGGYRVSVGVGRLPPPPAPPSPPEAPADEVLINWVANHFEQGRTNIALDFYDDILDFVEDLAKGIDQAKAVKVIEYMHGVFFALGVAADTKSALDEIANPTRYSVEKTVFVELTTLMAGLGVAAGATIALSPAGGFVAGIIWEFGGRDVFKALASGYYDLVTSGQLITPDKLAGLYHELAATAAGNSEAADATDLVLFDEHYYLNAYHEVSGMIAQGQFGSAYAHYLSIGIDLGYRPNAGQILSRDDLAIRLLNDDPHALFVSSLFTQPLGQLAGDGIGGAELSVANLLSRSAGPAQGGVLDADLSAIAHRKALDLAVNAPGDTIASSAAANSLWALQWSDGSDFTQVFAADLEALLGAGAPATSCRLFVTASSSGSPADVLARFQAQQGWNLSGFDTFGIAEFGGHWVVIVADRAAGVNAVAPGAETLATASIYGSNADESLYAGTRAGRLFGLGGNDTLVAGTGADYLDGGLGDDRYALNSAEDQVIELSGGGSDTVFASVSYALASGVEVEILSTIDYDGHDAINLTGNGFAQQVWGDAGTNFLDGRGGNDFIFGGNGNDMLLGGDGDDYLYGDAGWDRLTGGAGADRFMFELLNDSHGYALRSDGKKYMPDIIADFSSGQDKIDLAAIDAIAGTAANDAFRFIGTSAFSHHAGELRIQVQGDSSLIFADVDGDGAADMTIAASAPSLQATDFIL